MREPMMTVRSRGSPKYSAASAVMRDAAGEEDGGARYPVQRGFHGVQPVDERWERPLFADPLKRDEFAASLPGGEDGKDGDADQQGNPRSVHQLGQVGGEKEQVDGD